MATLVKEWDQSSFVGGMNDSPEAAQPNQVAFIQNGRVRPDGTVQCSPGAQQLNASSFGPGGTFDNVVGFFETMSASGTPYWLEITHNETTSFDQLKYSTDYGVTWGGATNLGPTTTAPIRYYSMVSMVVAGVVYVYMTNGAVATTIYRFNTTTPGVATATTPVTFKYLAVHRSRLWGALPGDVSVYGSKIDDPATWTPPDGLVLPVQSNDGEGSRGLFSCGTELLVHKRSSVSRITGTGNSDIIVVAGSSSMTHGIGMLAGHRTICALIGTEGASIGAIWFSERGVEVYYQGVGVRTIALNLRNTIASLNWPHIAAGDDGEPWGAYDPISDIYTVGTYTTGSPVAINDTLLRVNVRTGACEYDFAPFSFGGATGAIIGKTPSGRRGLVLASMGFAYVYDEYTGAGPVRVQPTMTLRTHRIQGTKRQIRRVVVHVSRTGEGAALTAQLFADGTQASLGTASTTQTLEPGDNHRVKRLVFGVSARVEDNFQLQLSSTAIGGLDVLKIHKIEVWSQPNMSLR